MMRKFLFLTINMAMLGTLVTGCWDSKELNDQAIETALGVDLNNDGTIRCTLQILSPFNASIGEKGKDKSVFTVSENGRTIIEAISHIQQRLSRYVFGGHREVVIIGESLAKYGISDILDEFTRNPAVRLRMDMFIVRGGDAEDFLKLTYPLEYIPARALPEIHKVNGAHWTLTLRNFLMAATGEEGSPYLPVIDIYKVDEGVEPTLGLGGKAIFDQELKLVGYMNEEETSYQQWIRGESDFLELFVKIPHETTEIAMKVRHLKKKIKTVEKGRKVSIHVTLSGIATILEDNTRYDFNQFQNMKTLQKHLSSQTEQTVRQCIQKGQSLGADVFGFGEAFHRQHPSKWKEMKQDWGERFKEAEITTSINVIVRYTGLEGPAQMWKNDQIIK
ncbi:Ger(x)C family spore germination protein [Paenibacillus sp. 1001270B_150601_E10]|uniref:Ger(x)C family spore germination protein n=1 Tax=Paenibacillus sp. 1001270B_150601_E10 TaxID=2787079 RepID=UPI00189FDE73|nr:Ger(x)C family spore germination protein [Paenibacillus sp. 1001270B_150601_E10]